MSVLARLRKSFEQYAQSSQLGRWILSSDLFSWLAPNEADSNLGLRGERLAAKYLKKLGYRIIAHSHRQRLGEIDLIAVDQAVMVFVEVKTWRSDAAADPSEAVNRSKQEKLTRAALIYLKQKRLLNHPARFDVISITWPHSTTAQPDVEPTVRHYKNAFEAVGSGQMYC